MTLARLGTTAAGKQRAGVVLPPRLWDLARGTPMGRACAWEDVRFASARVGIAPTDKGGAEVVLSAFGWYHIWGAPMG